MIAKKTLIVAGVALLATAMLAGATAHLTAANTLTTAAKSFGINGNPDPCRRMSLSSVAPLGDPCVNSYIHNGVSGSFVGASGATIFKSKIELNNPRVEICNPPDVRLNGAPCPTGGSLVLLAPTTLFPNGAVSQGAGLCDMEVLGDGSNSAGQQDSDERRVEAAAPYPASSYPDGTVDDGGSGTVCHLPSSSTHYSFAPYKTSGCVGNVAGSDWIQGGNVWLGVSCAANTATIGAPGASTCLTNAAIGSDKAGAVQRCIDAATAPGGSGGLLCGVATSAAINTLAFGFGRGPILGAVAVPYPVPNVNCPVLDTAGVVFVFNTVDVDLGTISPVAGGWVDGSN